ncbi:putative small lipoprotein YifL [Paenibacillus rhizosphaerae]|uniref:Putative small lipoprotein YifL n=1 Tax=Paenibacillus rhizosphaerae TaxID=297318 RepID=A0A839TLT0_9BACL|nr:GerMN domain-containing protein [Paenibacillus rhizosphaerae]MBB3127735.1 putative small lipoprotein YifL [Paenibacillus rhizosphaerae]
MNKKVWCAGVLALALVALAGCGQKPTAAPDQQQETASDQQVTGSGGDAAAGETGTEGTDSAVSSGSGQDQSSDQGQAPSGSQGQGQEAAGQGQSTSSQTTDSTQKSLNIDVYYTDPEELDLHKAQKEISFSSDDEKYKKAFEALQASDKSDLVPLWGKVELKSLSMKDGQLTMDIHLPDEARLGAGGEQFALDALGNTLFQFDEVKSIELLVDGAKVESLMGHVDLEHPMTRH